jgi:Fic family protein
MGRANRALANYGGVLLGVPNPEVLLSPLTTEEAVLSSRIEGTQATLGEVFLFEAGDAPAKEERRQDIGEILNYRRALGEAERELPHRPFSLNLLLRLHAILLDSVRGQNKARGKFRTEQNWIGSAGTPIEKAAFVPPAPADLPALLHNWECYYHADAPDILVQLAIVHAQFEILHPFLDGNGRLGRILVPLFLHEKKILPRPMFYLSSWLEARRDLYIRRLRALGREENAWNDWLHFFLTGLEEQARANAAKAHAILELYERMKLKVLSATHSRHAVPLLDQLFLRPFFTASQLKFPDRPTPTAVANLLRTLRQEKVVKIVRPASGRRAAVYVLTDLINLCEGKDPFR